MPLEAHYGPAYTALQASLITLGLSPAWAGWTVSSLAGSLAAGIVYVIGIRLWKRPVAAMTAAAIAVVNPTMVSASTHIYPESLSSLLLVLAVMSLVGERRVGMLSGIFLGFAALTRREAIVLVPFAVVLVLVDGTGGFRARRRRWRVREAALLVAGVAALFAPYLFYLRAVSGHWTLSDRTNFSWAVGRLMEEHPGEGIPFEEVRQFEARYPSPVAYFRAKPGESAARLAGSAWAHLRWAFMGELAWPVGIVALAGLGNAILRRRSLLWPPSPVLLPFVLVLAWSFAGPIQRYSKALGPFVCLIAGGMMVGRFSVSPSNDRGGWGPRTGC